MIICCCWFYFCDSCDDGGGGDDDENRCCYHDHCNDLFVVAVYYAVVFVFVCSEHPDPYYRFLQFVSVLIFLEEAVMTRLMMTRLMMILMMRLQ